MTAATRVSGQWAGGNNRIPYIATVAARMAMIGISMTSSAHWKASQARSPSIAASQKSPVTSWEARNAGYVRHPSPRNLNSYRMAMRLKPCTDGFAVCVPTTKMTSTSSPRSVTNRPTGGSALHGGRDLTRHADHSQRPPSSPPGLSIHPNRQQHGTPRAPSFVLVAGSNFIMPDDPMKTGTHLR